MKKTILFLLLAATVCAFSQGKSGTTLIPSGGSGTYTPSLNVTSDTIVVEMMVLAKQELKTDPAPSFIWLIGYRVSVVPTGYVYLDYQKRPLSDRLSVWISKPLNTNKSLKIDK